MSSSDKQEAAAEANNGLKYPKSIFFIISNEFCERFTYYGLRTVLTLYLTQRLFYSESTSTVIYHCFAMLAYFTPLLGAIIADSWLGKFRTILYLSILYAIGGIILSFGSFPNEITTMKIVSLVGLFVIAVGTGGIKPCVSAFGGDQFKDGQERQLKQFFSIFYLAINLGSVFSTFITPILREDVHCLGEKSCFPIAFGVPSILMVIAVLLFIFGKPFYKVRPPEGNIALKVTKCICTAIRLKCKSKSSEKKKDHWLDYAESKYDRKLIDEIKILLHVLVLYIPLPLFWALFDQQGSRWTLQATRLDGKIGSYHIKPDQIQVINPFLIIAFIPFFEYIVYPILNKCHICKTSLQRIAAGGTLAALSFVMAGFIELSIEGNLPVLPNAGQSQLTIINNSPCRIKIEPNGTVIDIFQSYVVELPIDEQNTWTFISEKCSENVAAKDRTLTFNLSSPIESMMITLNEGQLEALWSNDSIEKSEEGEPKVRIFYSLEIPDGSNMTFMLRDENDKEYSIETGSKSAYGMTDYIEMHPGLCKIYQQINDTEVDKIGEYDFKSGGAYIAYIFKRDIPSVESNYAVYSMVKGNTLSILYQIPQYFVITAGEIMFSITGLEFSYSQAPYSMKSVIQAAWLLTVAFGNLIVLVIAELELFEKQSHELFLFAVLMGVDMVIFAILAFFYKYVDIKTPSTEKAELAAQNATGSTGRSNEAYDEETDFNK